MDAVSKVNYRTMDVPVEGGTLRVAVWGERGPVVLCAHGTSGNLTCFQALADQLPSGVRLVAPDLRGRGRSNSINGPWGMRAHAADMIAVLDHLEIAKVDLLLGHSMGAFIAAVAAAHYPNRVGPVLMVDGGLPVVNASFIRFLPFSDYLTELLVKKIIGPSLARLDMTFESREANYAFWRKHPALAGDNWSKYVEQFIDYDLDGAPPTLRSSMRREPLVRDSRTQLVENIVPKSLKQMAGPVRLLRAERGLTDGPPLYKPETVARVGAKIREFSSRDLPDVNHFTIIMSEHGARLVADEVRSMLNGHASA